MFSLKQHKATVAWVRSMRNPLIILIEGEKSHRRMHHVFLSNSSQRQAIKSFELNFEQAIEKLVVTEQLFYNSDDMNDGTVRQAQ